jgi:hypothetical protein
VRHFDQLESTVSQAESQCECVTGSMLSGETSLTEKILCRPPRFVS